MHIIAVYQLQQYITLMQTGSGQSLVTRALVISLLNRIKVSQLAKSLPAVQTIQQLLWCIMYLDI